MTEGSSLTTRLSFGHSGIRVGLAGAFVQGITAPLFLRRLGEMFRLRARTAAAVALEAEATSARVRSARGRSVVHVAHGDIDCLFV